MREDSISLPHRRTTASRRRSSTADESLSFSTSETSSRGSRRLHYRTVIFPTRIDFALVIIGFQTDAIQLIFVFMQMEKYGGVVIFLATFLLGILLSLPLMVQQIFYGFYNKFGFIKFWNIAPVGFGIGISMALYSFYECVLWSSVAGLLVLHLCRAPFRSISLWTVCEKGEGPGGVECYDAVSKPETKSCDQTTFPGLEFYKKISYQPQITAGINGGWFVCCSVIWLLVFVMVSQGFRRLKTVLTRAPILYVLGLTLLAIFMFVSQRASSEEEEKTIFDAQEGFGRDSIILLILHAIRVIHIPLGTLIQLGSYSPSGTPLLADAVMILLFICLFNFAFAYFAHYCNAWIALRFSGIKRECLSPNTMTILFASVPTAVSFLAMGNFWLFVYFATFALKSLIQIVITLTATMNAMAETFNLHRHRQHVVAILCAVALLLNLPLTMTDSEVFLTRTCRYVELVADLVIVGSSSLAILFLYTVSRFLDDAHFAYKAEPVMFLKLTSYTSPILILFVVFAGLTSVMMIFGIDPALAGNPWASALIGFAMSVILAPVPAVALYMYIVHLTKHDLSAILEPTENWGPPEEGAKRARQNFNPRSELKHRSKKPCAHNCLVNNIRIKLEVEKRNAQRKEFFLNVFQRPSFAEWSQEEEWQSESDIIGKIPPVNWVADFSKRQRLVLDETLENSYSMEDYEDDDDDNDDESSDEDQDQEGGVVSTVHFLTQKPFNLRQRNFRIKSKPDCIILPNFHSLGPPACIQNLDTYVVAERNCELTPWYTGDHSTRHLQRRIPIWKKMPKSLIEPVSIL